MVTHREGGNNTPTQKAASRGIVANALARVAIALWHLAYSLRSVSSWPWLCCFLGFCCAGAVPSPSSRRRTPTFRLAIAAGITCSRPGGLRGTRLQAKLAFDGFHGSHMAVAR